ncbi:MAG: transposase, partial [Chlorobiaceae bacterium]
NIVKAIAAIDRMFDAEERLVYDIRMQEFTDVASAIATGAEKNIAKGMEKASKAIVLNMAGKGIDINAIAELTGLNVSDIADLLQSTNEQ